MSLGYEFQPIDVAITTHPKAFAAGVESMGLWLWGMAYAKLHRTGGRLHRASVLGAWGGKRNIMHAKRLVEAGLWILREDGDWDIFNFVAKGPGGSSTERVQKHRAKRAKATEPAPPESVTRNAHETGNETDVTAGVKRFASPSHSVSLSVSPERVQGEVVRRDAPLADDARAAWDTGTFTGDPGKTIEAVWLAFCGHFAGQEFPSRESMIGRWQKWVAKECDIAKERRIDKRDRDDAWKQRRDGPPPPPKPTREQSKAMADELARRVLGGRKAVNE